MRGAEELLGEFVERVLRRGELGKVVELCNQRAVLHLPRNRRLYSVSLVEEGLSVFLRSNPTKDTEIEELWSAEAGLTYPEDGELEGAAALLRFSCDGQARAEQGMVSIRAARGRIHSIRIETGLIMGGGEADISFLPASSVQVFTLVGELPVPLVLDSPDISELLREYRDELAGRRLGSESSDGESLFGTPGGVFFDEIVGMRRKGGGYVLSLAWYKGILLPRNDMIVPDYAPLASTTVSGVSFIEFDGRERLRDLRFFDDTEFTCLREFALPGSGLDPESIHDSYVERD